VRITVVGTGNIVVPHDRIKNKAELVLRRNGVPVADEEPPKDLKQYGFNWGLRIAVISLEL
jgi:hypothetical protein